MKFSHAIAAETPVTLVRGLKARSDGPTRWLTEPRANSETNPPEYLATHAQRICMQSVRKGLRSDELKKDTYGRLTCTECGETLKTENDPSEVGSVRICPSCGRKWKDLG